MNELTRRSVLKALGGAAGATALGPLIGTANQALAAKKSINGGSSSLGSTGYQIITVLSAAASNLLMPAILSLHGWWRREHVFAW